MSNIEKTNGELELAAQACQDAAVRIRRAIRADNPREKREEVTAAIRRVDERFAPIRAHLGEK